MGLTYELRWKIRFAVDRRARRRLRHERLIAVELEELRSEQRAAQSEMRQRREAEWRAALPAMLDEWRAREA